MCVPYSSPKKEYLSLEEIAQTVMPNFGYQIQFASGEIEKVVQSKEEIKQFLTALLGGRTPEKQNGFEAEKGVILDRLMRLRHSRLLSEEVSLLVLWKKCIWSYGLTFYFFFFLSRNWSTMGRSIRGTGFMRRVGLTFVVFCYITLTNAI